MNEYAREQASTSARAAIGPRVHSEASRSRAPDREKTDQTIRQAHAATRVSSGLKESLNRSPRVTQMLRLAARLQEKTTLGVPIDRVLDRQNAPGAGGKHPGERSDPASSGAGSVAQRSPAVWVASPQVATILGIAHGWWSTEWKPLKDEIVAYKALPRPNFVARRAALARMTTLINAWRANPKHPVTSSDARIHAIHQNLPILESLIAEEENDMRAQEAEAVVGGHSLVRHGADATDLDLQNRITTGLDRSGAAAATDQSSRFSTHQEWIRTRTLAVNALDAAAAATQGIVNPLLGAFEADWWTGLQMIPGAAKGTALQNANNRKPAISTAVANIGLVNPNHLPVTYHNVAAPGAAPTAPHVHGLVQNMVRTRARYAITINHNRNIGPSFLGTGPAGGPHPGTVPGPQQRSTTTVFNVPIGSLAALPAAANWPMVTHYPSSDPAGIDSR